MIGSVYYDGSFAVPGGVHCVVIVSFVVAGHCEVENSECRALTGECVVIQRECYVVPSQVE